MAARCALTSRLGWTSDRVSIRAELNRRNRKLKQTSVCAERDQRIDFCCAARGDVAGEESNQESAERDG